MNKICLIKAGSAVVTREDGSLDLNTIQDIGKMISYIVKNGWSPILVSSGASSAGKGFLGTHSISNDTIKPITASIGQSNLIAYYINLLKIHSPLTQVAQLLINRRNLTNINVYKFVKKNLLTMLSNNILPIINENDVLWENEINFSDNDHLASVIASMLHVHTVVLFSDVDAIYTKNPQLYSDAKKIKHLDQNYENWNISIDDSNVSNGGMKSKLDVFRMMSILGINVHLLSKNFLSNSNHILDILNLKSENTGTHLISKKKKSFSFYKKWLLSSSVPKGIIIISKKGALALSETNNIKHRTNLYCIGIENFFGKFNKGDIVSLRDEKFNLIGFGKTSYSFDDLLEKKCEQGKVFIHNDFVISIKDDFFVDRERELIEQHVYNLKVLEGYRVKQNKPKIIIDNKRKGKSKENNSYIETIELDEENSSNIRYEAKKSCNKFNIPSCNIDDWIIFRVLLGKK